MEQSMEPVQTPHPFWRALSAFGRVVWRLFVLAIVGTLVGAGIYFGVPWVYNTLVRPVQENNARISALEQQQALEGVRLQEEALALQARVSTLETELATLRETTAMQAQALTDAGQYTADLEAQIALLQANLAQLTLDLTAQQALLETYQMELTELDNLVYMRTLNVVLRNDALTWRLSLVQTAQDLLKVRLLLLEDNSRAARDALALAATHLARVEAADATVAAQLKALQERMTALDGLIEARSFRVGPELESLWADLVDLALPPGEAPMFLIPTPTPWLTPTPYDGAALPITPTPTPWITPTPTPTPTPWLTPTPTP